jgi:hypothetical protein
VFNLDIIADEDAKAPFPFQLDGKSYRVPHVSDLTLGQQINLDGSRGHQVFREVGEVLDGEEWKPAGGDLAKAYLALKPARAGKLLAAWLSHAGVEPGESPASPR